MDFIKIINILYVMDSTDIADFILIMCMLWILTNYVYVMDFILFMCMLWILF